jgi:hypothetical protein
LGFVSRHGFLFFNLAFIGWLLHLYWNKSDDPNQTDVFCHFGSFCMANRVFLLNLKSKIPEKKV